MLYAKIYCKICFELIGIDFDHLLNNKLYQKKCFYFRAYATLCMKAYSMKKNEM